MCIISGIANAYTKRIYASNTTKRTAQNGERQIEINEGKVKENTNPLINHDTIDTTGQNTSQNIVVNAEDGQRKEIPEIIDTQKKEGAKIEPRNVANNQRPQLPPNLPQPQHRPQGKPLKNKRVLTLDRQFLQVLATVPVEEKNRLPTSSIGEPWPYPTHRKLHRNVSLYKKDINIVLPSTTCDIVVEAVRRYEENTKALYEEFSSYKMPTVEEKESVISSVVIEVKCGENGTLPSVHMNESCK